MDQPATDVPLAQSSAAACAVAAALFCLLLADAAVAQAPAGSTVSLCSAAITGSSGTTVDVSYAGLPGNQPKRYGNVVALWQNSVVAWTIAPAIRLAVPTDAEVGTVVLEGAAISRIPNTIAYAVGPQVEDTCASALLAADGSTALVDAVSLELISQGTTSLTLRYHTLSGYLPATAGNWIGLWRGRASPYNAPSPLARVKVTENVTDARIAINGVTLVAGDVYTAIYFMDEALTTAAALLTFTVPTR